MTDVHHGSPWVYAPFRHVVLARSLSGAASYMQIVGAGWLVFHLSGSAMAVGILAALALGPSLVGAPIGGALSDRFCPRKLGITFALLQILSPAAMAILAFNDQLTIPLIYALVLLGAIPYSLGQPVMALIIPFTVPADLRHQAVAGSSMAYNISRLLGAALGGVVLSWIGPAGTFAANAASYAVVAWVLWRAKVIQSACDQARAHRSGGIVGGVREGWHFPVVRIVAVGAGMFFLFIGPLEQLMPKVAAAHGDDPMMLGVLLAAIGVGGLLANPFIKRRVMDSMSGSAAIAVGLAVGCCGIAFLAVSPGYLADLASLLLVGAGWEFVFVSGQGALTLDVPRDISGRMIGFFYVLVTATAAAGALLMGYMFDHLGLRVSLLAVATVVAATAVVLWLRAHAGNFVVDPESTAGR